jgi:hypothetical protein
MRGQIAQRRQLKPGAATTSPAAAPRKTAVNDASTATATRDVSEAPVARMSAAAPRAPAAMEAATVKATTRPTQLTRPADAALGPTLSSGSRVTGAGPSWAGTVPSVSRGGVEIDAWDEGQPCRGWCPCGWRSQYFRRDGYARAMWRQHASACSALSPPAKRASADAGEATDG